MARRLLPSPAGISATWTSSSPRACSSGLTIAFHYIFPPLSSASASCCAHGGAFLRTRDPLYQQMTRFWVRVFGLTFAIGVASGIVMGVPVRHQLGRVLASSATSSAALSRRRRFAFFPSQVSRCCCSAGTASGRAKPLLLDADGLPRRALQRGVDHRRELVDADAGRLPGGRRGSRGAPRRRTSGRSCSTVDGRPSHATRFSARGRRARSSCRR